ncbi:MAG TPA: uL22 family ribosomal protein [Clostridia bacterium]|nr:uL22 family ribosomal protein [Clostridia bacterium]
MEVKASAKYLRISPRKLRQLTYNLRGRRPAEALLLLEKSPQKGKEFLRKLIMQAKANAINNFKLTEENLRIKKLEVGDGPAYKRMDKSHGARFDRGIIKKRTAHLFLTLEAEEKAEAAKPAKAATAKRKRKVEKQAEPKKAVKNTRKEKKRK